MEYADALIPEVIRRAPEDPLLFIKSLVIPSAHGPRLFSEVMQPFQEDLFSVLMPSLRAVSRWEVPAKRRFWAERTKKASKDSDIAAALIWLMAFCERPCKAQVCASNRKQAKIIENRATEILHYNPWLKGLVEIVDGNIRSKSRWREVWTHIEATDASGGAHGEAPEVLVLNELVHVARWRAMEDHLSNAEGVPRGVVVIATNAGYKNTKAWTWREMYRLNPRWFFQVWHGKAPWLSDDDIQEAKDKDPIGSEFARLFGGVWQSGVGDALSEDVINSMFVLKGPAKGRPRSGWDFLMGLDLGISKDHAGVGIVGVSKTRQVARIARIRGFAPSLRNKESGKPEVDSGKVEVYVEEMAKKFRAPVFYDPAAGGSFMAQRLRKKGIRMIEAPFNSTTFQTEMATALVQLAEDGRLQCYEDPEGRMRRDIGKFSIESKLGKYKLVAASDEHGHADVGVAVVMTLPRALEMMGEIRGYSSTDVMASGSEDPLDDSEVEAMPKELREIYEM